MKKLRLMATAVLVVGLPSAGLAQYPNNGHVGVYADAAGTQCCIIAPLYTVTDAHVISWLTGATAAGVTGTEFRIEVSPAPTGSYLLVWTPSPSLGVALGDPIDDTPYDPYDAKGCDLAFATCQPTLPGSPVEWGRIRIIGLHPSLPALTLKVKQKSPPSSWEHLCPLFWLCDEPVYSVVHMTLTQDELGGEEPVAFTSYVNFAPDTPCGRVAAAPATWSGVKELFR